MSTGMIFDIKRYSLHDGPGIRTTVFLKGCPLSCAWCHNPESQSPQSELIFRPARCLACGECLEDCPQEAIRFVEGGIIQDWDLCQAHGACVEVCYPGARELVGQEISPRAVLAEVVRDRAYYDVSEGGVTFSGGEPLSQADFLEACLRLCKEAGLQTALDTCGSAAWADLERQLPYLDLVLYDLKTLDEDTHRHYTGSSNRAILENFQALIETGIEIRVRRPVIPGLNDSEEEIDHLGEYLKSLSGTIKIDLLPYHALSADKYTRLGRGGEVRDWEIPSEALLDRIQGQLAGKGLAVGLRG